MPLEGQAERLRTPLGSRDRRLLVILGALTLVAAVAGIAYAISRPAASDSGCVVVTIPGSVGGVTMRHCGADAVRFCRLDGPGDDRIAVACRRAGYAVTQKLG